MARQAVVVTVGDEILAGYTQDTNSHWIARRLRENGIRLVAMETVPDEPDAIAASLRRHLASGADVVFVVGGIGPTPDDRTYPAVAKALGRRLVVDEANERRMEERARAAGYSERELADAESREALLRMIRIPKGARAVENPVGAALGSWIEHEGAVVVVLPGVPREMTTMMERSVLSWLGRDADDSVVREYETRGQEARWFPLLSRIEREFPRVRVGSYPQDEKGRIVLRVSGSGDDVDEVIARFRRFDAS